MDKNNDFENAVEVTSVTTEPPKSKNRIRKRHESKLRKTLRIIKNIICWGVLAILVLTVIVFMGSKVNGKTPSLFRASSFNGQYAARAYDRRCYSRKER